MMKFRVMAAVAVGGFAGALSRYMLSQESLYWGNAPLNILLINIMGAFLLAFFLELSLGRLHISAAIRTGISTGFLGAFTTFSGLCSEAFILGETTGFAVAGLYTGGSLVGGLLAALGGVAAARRLIGRRGGHCE